MVAEKKTVSTVIDVLADIIEEVATDIEFNEMKRDAGVWVEAHRYISELPKMCQDEGYAQWRTLKAISEEEIASEGLHSNRNA